MADRWYGLLIFPSIALSLWALGVLAVADGAGVAETLSSPGRPTLVFYWGVRCPHCAKAKPFVEQLGSEFPGADVERVEVQRSKLGRNRFLRHMRELGVSGAGVPTFVIGRRAISGFTPGRTEEEVRAAITAALAGRSMDADTLPVVELPLFGSVDAKSSSLLSLTLLLGLADGFNPCAFWVLTVLLSVLLRVRSRLRLFLFGGLFVLVSGLVYFLFMTAWITVFAFAGLSETLTRALGIGLLVMGSINLKDLVWFRTGPSLSIPDRAKPAIYRRMRAIANATSLPLAIVAIVFLAFLVNLVELGCTIGLPAVYTRILSLTPGLSPWTRYAYLGMYNVAYVVPLALVVLAYALTFHRFSMTERGARVLKAVSGLLLLGFGLFFLMSPSTFS